MERVGTGSSVHVGASRLHRSACHRSTPEVVLTAHSHSALLNAHATMSRGFHGGRSRGGKRGRDRSDAAGDAASDGRDDASSSGGPLRQREAYMRMNFLFQAAQLTASGPAACLPLSRFYAATMRKIGSRLTIRSSPPLKSDTCKVCYSLLTPRAEAAEGDGSDSQVIAAGAVFKAARMGSSVALQSSSPGAEPALVRTCRCCGTQRRVGLKRHSKRQAVAAAQNVTAGEVKHAGSAQQATTASDPLQASGPLVTAAVALTSADALDEAMR